MIDVRVTNMNGGVVAGQLVGVGVAVDYRARQITEHYGQLLQSKIKGHAMSAFHKPGERHIGGYVGEGPNVATGDYNRSITLEMSEDAGSYVATVGTDKVQGAKLEYGIGLPGPLPHFEPGLNDVREQFFAALNTMFTSGGQGGIQGQFF